VSGRGYPEDSAVETWERDVATFSISRHERLGHFCGYVRFPRRPVSEPGYDGLLVYVPVHGGLTYASEADDGTMVYGFDCNHADDDHDPKTRDMEWLRAECHRMATAISIAAGYEEEYLLARDNTAKAAVIEAYHERLKAEQIDFTLTDNLGAMISVLTGEL
jgi:hypothetical protein